MKINITNHDKISNELDKVQHRAKTRTLTAARLQELVNSFENQFPCPKVYQKGIRIHVQIGFGGSKPSSYNGTPESTYATVERFQSGWFMTGAGRTFCPNGGDRVQFIGTSDEARMKEAILTHVLDKVYH